MAGGRKTVNRKFVLLSETLLEDYKVIRTFIILIHLLSLFLGIAAALIGVFAYIPASATGTSSLQFVNCTLSPQIQPGVQFPVQLLLLLTGIGLVALDVSASLLLCVIKKLSCGVVSIVWFLGSAICVTVWTIWSIVYAAVVFPVWQNDRSTCDDLVMISMLVGVGVMTFFMVLYGLIIVVALWYDCWYRCDIECTCRRRKDREFDDY